MRTWSDIISPPTFDPRQVEIHEKINLYMRDISSALGMVGRGKTPDQSGRPLIEVADDGRFFLLKGRPFGQKAHGAVETGGSLTLSSTYHATKGLIYLGAAQSSGYDEANHRLGIGTVLPESPLHVIGDEPGVTTVYMYPTADQTVGGWQTQAGGVTNLYQGIDDDAASLSDADYIVSTDFTSYICELTDGVTPDPSATVTIKFRGKLASGVGTIFFDLWEGVLTKLITTSGTVSATASFQDYSLTLTAAEIAGVSNWNNLRFKFQKTGNNVTIAYAHIEITTGSGTNLGEAITVDQDSGYRALRIRAPFNDLTITTPSGSAGTPWLVKPDSSGLLAFSGWTDVIISGSSSRFKMQTTDTSGSWLVASNTSTSGVGTLSITGTTAMVDPNDAVTYPAVLSCGVSSAGATVGARFFGKPSGQTGHIIEIGLGASVGSSIRTIVDKDANVGVRTGSITLGAALQVYPASAAGIGVLIRGLTAQTANLLEIQSVTPTTFLSVTSAGKLVLTVAPQINVPAGAVTAGHVWTATDVDGNGNWAAAAGGAEKEELGYYGDGSDGNITLNGGASVSGLYTKIGSTYYLLRDVFADQLTVTNTYTLNTSGWRIFAKTGVTVDAGGFIDYSGLAGAAGANAAAAGTPAGGAGGNALPDTGTQALGGSGAGGAGRNGQVGVGASGTFGSTSTGEGGGGGAGGQGEVSFTLAAGGAVRPGGTIITAKWRSTTGVVMAINFLIIVNGGAGGSGGSSGGGDGVSRGAAGGGGGSGGGVIGIWAKAISISGTLSANGGAGGAGGNTDGSGGAGGGGGGGGGGYIYLYYDTYTASGTVSVNGGAAGATGTLGGFAGVPTAAVAGSTGNIVKYCRTTGVFS
jgi:hypothetical protein